MDGFAERSWRSGDGLLLYARDYAGASGPARLPVICLHGLTRNSKDFEDIAPRLAANGRRILVPDMRGRGRSESDPRPDRYKPLVYGRDVLDLMDHLGIARAVFIGTSMGGMITLTIAGLRQKAIASAILMQPPMYGESTAPPSLIMMARAGRFSRGAPSATKADSPFSTMIRRSWSLLPRARRRLAALSPPYCSGVWREAVQHCSSAGNCRI